MVNFIGGFGHDGQARPISYRRLKEAADALTITSTTPEGPANLLGTGRAMFALSIYDYRMLLASVANSIFAVEGALKLRLKMKGTFDSLIKKAVADGLVTPEVADIVDTGRKIRNGFIHEGKIPRWTFGMAYNGLSASYRLVSELYPEPAP